MGAIGHYPESHRAHGALLQGYFSRTPPARTITRDLR